MYHFENILVASIFILAHFLLFIFNYRILGKKIMQPAVLFSLVWFIILTLHLIFSFTILNELSPLNISTYLIFFIGAVFFSIGSYIQTILWQKKNNMHNVQSNSVVYADENSRLLHYILLSITLIGLPFFIYTSYQLFLLSNLDNFFVGLRTEVSYGGVDIGILKYFFAFSVVVYAFILQSYLRKKDFTSTILVIISFFVTLIYSVFSSGRLLFLLLLAVYLGMKFLHSRDKFSIKRVLIVVCLFMAGFIVFGILYNKGGDTESHITENIKPAAEGTAIYMVASVNALQYQLHDNFHINYNVDNSLRFFRKLAMNLNMIPSGQITDHIQAFVLIPYPTNVYTCYSPYIADFGKLYAWFIFFVLGLFQAYLYNKSLQKKDFRSSFWYALMLFPLLVSFFDDQYFSLLSFWIQFAFFVETIIVLNKLFVYKKLYIKARPEK